MGRHLVNSLAMVAFALAQPGFAAPGFNRSGEAAEAAHRVNISGRQRMLSQRIAKSACFLNIEAAAEDQLAQLLDAVGMFADSLQALRAGDEAAGLGPEQNPMIREALTVVSNDWEVFYGHLQTAINAGFVARPALSGIDESGLRLLANMNRVVNKTASIYGDTLPDMPLILSLTIDLAGRQRMFTQKAAKEFCLIEAGVNVEQNRERLAKTTRLFTLTLRALQSGMPGMVMAAPNAAIRNQLTAVAEAWAGPKVVLESIAGGKAASAAQRQVIMSDMEQVLALMNEVVAMYEGVIPEPE